MRKNIKAAIVVATVCALTAATAFATGWQKNGTGWWYGTNADNTTWHTGSWQWIDGNNDGIAECYYFDANGYMLAATVTPDGYTVNANGAWTNGDAVPTKAAGSVDAGGSNGSGTSTSTSGGSTAGNTATGGSSGLRWNQAGIVPVGNGVYELVIGNKQSSSSSSQDYSSYADECFELINKERTSRGLSALEYASDIAEACDIRAQELVEKFDHTRPDGSSCSTAFDEVGASYGTWGENIAAGSTTPASTVESWMNSSGHKANILKKSFTKGSIGFCYDPNSEYKYYWVQMFGA